MSESHLSGEVLAVLLRGEIESDQAETLFAHIEGCEICIERADLAWSEISPLRGDEEMGQQTALQIERVILRRVHQVDIAESITFLGSQGMLVVLLGLLRPWLALLQIFEPGTQRRRP